MIPTFSRTRQCNWSLLEPDSTSPLKAWRHIPGGLNPKFVLLCNIWRAWVKLAVIHTFFWWEMLAGNRHFACEVCAGVPLILVGKVCASVPLILTCDAHTSVPLILACKVCASVPLILACKVCATVPLILACEVCASVPLILTCDAHASVQLILVGKVCASVPLILACKYVPLCH